MSSEPTSTAPTLAAEIALDAGDELGENPFWDVPGQRLLRVDIKAGAHHSWSPADGSTTSMLLGGQLGFAIPRRGGGLVAGVDRRVVLVEPDGTTGTVATVERDRAANRFNDARCDAAGRLWAGTMSLTREPGVAALYRIEPGGGAELAIGGLTISNGLGWSPDSRSMYLIDSTTQRIDVLDYDLGSGRVGERRPFAHVDPGDGLPDGLAVDSEGGVWVALFGGGEVRRYTHDGTLDVRVKLPTLNCTCPAFGGPDLGDLYVTSARHKLDPSQLAAQPHAGAVFRVRTGHRGLTPVRFAG